MTQQSLTILGSTGTIGVNTLRVAAMHPERFRIACLTAGDNAELLIAQAQEHRPKRVVIANESRYATLKNALSGMDIEVASGAQAVIDAAREPSDITMVAIVGASGLEPTLAAIEHGKKVAIANKESLVCAGELVMHKVAACGTTLIPVDSEHNAIFQLQPNWADVTQVLLTASGGPFRTLSLAEMEHVTAAQAVKHPNWHMGAKISVDSATLMNKALELIEAHHLFGLPEPKLGAIIHPQSIIHCLITMRDGSVLSHMSQPDMCTPIACALAWPERIEAPTAPLNLAQIGRLEFETPDESRFPALRLVHEVMRSGGNAATIFNAANEVAVSAFLEGQIGFLEIVPIVEASLAKMAHSSLLHIDDVLQCNQDARRTAEYFISNTKQKRA